MEQKMLLGDGRGGASEDITLFIEGCPLKEICDSHFWMKRDERSQEIQESCNASNCAYCTDYGSMKKTCETYIKSFFKKGVAAA